MDASIAIMAEKPRRPTGTAKDTEINLIVQEGGVCERPNLPPPKKPVYPAELLMHGYNGGYSCVPRLSTAFLRADYKSLKKNIIQE